MLRKHLSRNRHCHSKSGISLPKEFAGLIPDLQWFLREEAENGFQLRVPKYQIPEDCLWYRHVIAVEMHPAVLYTYQQRRDAYVRQLRANGEHVLADALPPIRLVERGLKKDINALQRNTQIKDGVVFLEYDPEVKGKAIQVHSRFVIERKQQPPRVFTYNFQMSNSVRETLDTAAMAKALDISDKLLRRLRRMPDSPFQLGIHYRFQGITTSAPVRWFPAATDEAFSTFKRVDVNQIETLPGLMLGDLPPNGNQS